MGTKTPLPVLLSLKNCASEINVTLQESLYRYKNLMAPYEKLISTANIEEHLKEGITLKS